MAPIRTSLYYFPKHKGKVVGIIVCGFGFSASFMNFIAEAVINPNKEDPDIHGYYPLEIAERVS